MLPCDWYNTGNGYCEDENNHIGCNFDGGDCCDKSPHIWIVNTTYCTICHCYIESITTTTTTTETTTGGRVISILFCEL